MMCTMKKKHKGYTVHELVTVVSIFVAALAATVGVTRCSDTADAKEQVHTKTTQQEEFRANPVQEEVKVRYTILNLLTHQEWTSKYGVQCIRSVTEFRDEKTGEMVTLNNVPVIITKETK